MRFRLHSRLVLWNLLIIGLISAILGYFLNFSLRREIEKEIEGQLLDQSTLAAAYLAKANPGKPMDEQADELGRLLSLRVTIIAPMLTLHNFRISKITGCVPRSNRLCAREPVPPSDGATR